MTARRSFLRNLIAAIVLAPVVAKFAEALPVLDLTVDAFEWLPEPMPPRFEFRDGEYVRVPNRTGDELNWPVNPSWHNLTVDPTV